MERLDPGDLVFIAVSDTGTTLSVSARSKNNTVREYFHGSDARHISLGQLTGLIKKIEKNKLGQPQTYVLLIGVTEYRCRSVLAERYFEKI
mgnify:FL=1|jgi:hypothetical protein|tara:strand:- start:359 stop:631 length:273 start_codon:yes stop_codon:yes gene_type:complete